MTAPPTLSLQVLLAPEVGMRDADLPGSWYISHGLGGPAAGLYTEVALGDNALIDPDGQPWPEHIIERAVREAAVSLYGRAWAFLYRPDQAADAIHRYGLRRRERAVITSIECWA